MPSIEKPLKLGDYFKRELSKLIDSENKHRQRLHNTIKLLENRIMAKMIIDAGGEAVIMNAMGGDDHITTEELKKHNLETMIKTKESTEEGVKYSTMKEKFFRYVWLNNWDKALKYDTKCADWWNEQNENLWELVRGDSGVALVSLHYDDVSLNTQTKGEQGYREHCDEMARFYKVRVSLLNHLRACRGIDIVSHD